VISRFTFNTLIICIIYIVGKTGCYIIDQDYVVVDHPETSSKEENVLRTRASTYQKLIDNLASDCPAYKISPTRWDVDEWMMSKPNVWDRITAYVAENKLKAAKEAEVLQK